MKKLRCFFSVSVLMVAVGCIQTVPTPPKAKIESKELTMHGHTRIDNFYWLRERENPEVISYLEAENEYTTAVMAHTKDLQEKLFQEIKGREKQDDRSVPYFRDGYHYYHRFVKGAEYRIFCRKKGSLDVAEEIILDVNKVAEGHDFCSVWQGAVSPNNELMAWSVDFQGSQKYTVRIRNLSTGEDLKDTISEVTGNVAWANDSKTLFYSKQHPETLRPYQIYRHTLGTDPAEDELVYQEEDETFRCRITKSRSKKYLFIRSRQTLSTEYRYLDAGTPDGAFAVVHLRERGLEYHVDHYDSKFYIRTNWEAENFRLMETSISATSKDNWKEVIPHRDDVLLQNFLLFKNHLVLSERSRGLSQIRIISWSGSGEHYLEFEQPAYVVSVEENPEFETDTLRYQYQSMTTPPSTFDYNMVTRERKLLREQPVLGGFDKSNYITERIYAPATDGARIPISLVYNRGLKRDGSQPLLLHGYGAYGYSQEPTFGAPRISLLDRGFTYAIAHVRGGQELGRSWYENGKLLKKKNTFTDFIACAEHLIEEGYTRPEQLFAMGGSGGGLLMGAVANMRPELFKGILASVPFVDIVTDMLDDSLPLTTEEYDEWGDPNQKKYYEYMLSYSPYDNVQGRDYPNLLVTASLNDPEVFYFDPAKWVAKLRSLKTDSNRLLLKTNMDAGHYGPSGRYERYREGAFNMAFMLDLAGVTQ